MAVRHSFIEYSFTLNLQTFLKHRLTLVTSISYIFDKSSTLVIQFENPCSCKRNSWLYTCFTNWEFGIWYNRLKKLSNDIWHDTLGGNCPHSPITIKFDVVALTLNMQRIYRKNTRSKSNKSSKPDLQKPHTSLPGSQTDKNVFQVSEALYFLWSSVRKRSLYELDHRGTGSYREKYLGWLVV